MWDEFQGWADSMLVRARVQVCPRALTWASRPMAGMPVECRPWRRDQVRGSRATMDETERDNKLTWMPLEGASAVSRQTFGCNMLPDDLDQGKHGRLCSSRLVRLTPLRLTCAISSYHKIHQSLRADRLSHPLQMFEGGCRTSWQLPTWWCGKTIAGHDGAMKID